MPRVNAIPDHQHSETQVGQSPSKPFSEEATCLRTFNACESELVLLMNRVLEM